MLLPSRVVHGSSSVAGCLYLGTWLCRGSGCGGICLGTFLFFVHDGDLRLGACTFIVCGNNLSCPACDRLRTIFAVADSRLGITHGIVLRCRVVSMHICPHPFEFVVAIGISIIVASYPFNSITAAVPMLLMPHSLELGCGVPIVPASQSVSQSSCMKAARVVHHSRGTRLTIIVISIFATRDKSHFLHLLLIRLELLHCIAIRSGECGFDLGSCNLNAKGAGARILELPMYKPPETAPMCPANSIPWPESARTPQPSGASLPQPARKLLGWCFFPAPPDKKAARTYFWHRSGTGLASRCPSAGSAGSS